MSLNKKNLIILFIGLIVLKIKFYNLKNEIYRLQVKFLLADTNLTVFSSSKTPADIL